MNDLQHGQFGNQNRKFLAGIYKPKRTDVFMKLAQSESLPMNCDLRSLIGNIDVYNQGTLGSCTANAIAGAYKILSIIKYNKSVSISRLFVYFNERLMRGQVYVDSGAFIKDGFLSMQTEGSCLEQYWPYIPSQFTVYPPVICYNEARLHQTSGYNAQLDPTDMVLSVKQCLALKLPVVIGIMVYESFESDDAAKTGLIPYPDVTKEKLLGGHALVALGYDDNVNHFIVLNSWSDAWGDHGFCYIPYAFVANNDLCNDCHAFSDVELKLVDTDQDPNKCIECLSPKKVLNRCSTI